MHICSLSHKISFTCLLSHIHRQISCGSTVALGQNSHLHGAELVPLWWLFRQANTNFINPGVNTPWTFVSSFQCFYWTLQPSLSISPIFNHICHEVHSGDVDVTHAECEMFLACFKLRPVAQSGGFNLRQKTKCYISYWRNSLTYMTMSQNTNLTTSTMKHKHVCMRKVGGIISPLLILLSSPPPPGSPFSIPNVLEVLCELLRGHCSSSLWNYYRDLLCWSDKLWGRFMVELVMVRTADPKTQANNKSTATCEHFHDTTLQTH